MHTPRSTLPLAGAPPSNATFFCDRSARWCYSVLQAPQSQSGARSACQAASGDLVRYDSADRQLAVESYFTRCAEQSIRLEANPASAVAPGAACSGFSGSARLQRSGAHPPALAVVLCRAGVLGRGAYWIGVARSPGVPYRQVDGAPLQQGASEAPYAHWHWAHPRAAAAAVADCVAAQGAFAYDK
jgi:hypothetical protein